MDGVLVTQMLFKGEHPETVVNQKLDDALLELCNKPTETIQEIRQDFK
jgi:hypothetical protein